MIQDIWKSRKLAKKGLKSGISHSGNPDDKSYSWLEPRGYEKSGRRVTWWIPTWWADPMMMIMIIIIIAIIIIIITIITLITIIMIVMIMILKNLVSA